MGRERLFFHMCNHVLLIKLMYRLWCKRDFRYPLTTCLCQIFLAKIVIQNIYPDYDWGQIMRAAVQQETLPVNLFIFKNVQSCFNTH